jgi:hypothetical protein
MKNSPHAAKSRSKTVMRFHRVFVLRVVSNSLIEDLPKSFYSRGEAISFCR